MTTDLKSSRNHGWRERNGRKKKRKENLVVERTRERKKCQKHKNASPCPDEEKAFFVCLFFIILVRSFVSLSLDCFYSRKNRVFVVHVSAMRAQAPSCLRRLPWRRCELAAPSLMATTTTTSMTREKHQCRQQNSRVLTSRCVFSVFFACFQYDALECRSLLCL